MTTIIYLSLMPLWLYMGYTLRNIMLLMQERNKYGRGGLNGRHHMPHMRAALDTASVRKTTVR